MIYRGTRRMPSAHAVNLAFERLGGLALRVDAGRSRHLLALAPSRVARRGVRPLRRGALAAGLSRHRHRARHRPRGDPRGPRRRGAPGRRGQPLARPHLRGPPARVHDHGRRDARPQLRRGDAPASPLAPLHGGQRGPGVLGERSTEDARAADRRARLRRSAARRARRRRRPRATRRRSRGSTSSRTCRARPSSACVSARCPRSTRAGRRSTC